MKKYSKYKDSGIKWIGEIPEHWDAVPIYAIANEFTKGQGITKEQVYTDGNTPCVRYGEIYSKYENSFDKCKSMTKIEDISNPTYFGYGDALFAGTGELIEEIGKSIVYLGNQKCLAGGDIIVLKHNQNPKFLSYCLNSIPVQSQKSYGKSKLKVVHISKDKIKRVVIALPSMKEQEIISEYLDHKTSLIDHFILKAQNEISLLNELKQAEIAHMVTCGINPNVPMKDSGIAWIGKIPEEWEIKRIAILFSENKNKNTDYEFHRALKFNYGRLIPKNETGDISELKDTYTAYTKIKKNDIAINCLNLNYDFISQRVAIAREDGILTSAYLIMSPRQGVNAEYYNYFFKSMDNKKLFHGMGTGIRLTLSYSELKKQYVIVPPVEEQSAIVAAIEVLNSKVDNLTSQLKKQISCLQELKQRVISDAVTGKIDVRDYNN
jgi:type I restriction enzyme S subunit